MDVTFFTHAQPILASTLVFGIVLLIGSISYVFKKS